MAELKVTHDSFRLTSTWTVYEDSYENLEITSGPSWAAKTVTFNYKIPAGAKLLGAYVHSEWGYPTSGFYAKTVNSIWVPDDTGNVTVEIDPSATSVDVVFRFRANGSASYPIGNREGSTTISNIYLLITYKLNGIIYHAVSGELVPYQLYRAENGVLVPYQIQHAEDGALAPYGG